MRLTNHLRDCFIRAVCNDLPEIVEPTGVEIQAALYENFDPKIKAVFDDEALRNNLLTQSVSWRKNRSNEYAHVVTCRQDVNKLPIMLASVAAHKKRHELITSLKGIAYGVSTLKALKEALPELTKYMADEAKKATPGLPVVANLYADLVAAGLKS